MAITRADIRAELPGEGPAVSDARIDAAIAAWSQMVSIKAGPSQLDTPLGQEIVRKGAHAWSLQTEQSRSNGFVSDEAVALEKAARDMLDYFDVEVAAAGEAGAVSGTLVTPITSSPLWTVDQLLKDNGLTEGVNNG